MKIVKYQIFASVNLCLKYSKNYQNKTKTQQIQKNHKKSKKAHSKTSISQQ